MTELVNKLRNWIAEVRDDVDVVEEAGLSKKGTEMSGMVKGQRVCTNEVEQILNDEEQ